VGRSYTSVPFPMMVRVMAFGIMYAKNILSYIYEGDSHGTRPVHLISTMIKWIRTSRLSIKTLSLNEGSNTKGSLILVESAVSRHVRELGVRPSWESVHPGSTSFQVKNNNFADM